MARRFNITGSCDPQFHYMVDIQGRLEKVKAFVDSGDYLTINRARQYGKMDNLSIALADGKITGLRNLFVHLSKLCAFSSKPVVLVIDEIDSATNNQVFLDFLSQLRAYYLARNKKASFQSVILAGVYDVKNSKRKIRPEEEHKVNSSWNIAADFTVNMNFNSYEIAEMFGFVKNNCNTVSITNRIFETVLYNYLLSEEIIDSRIYDSALADKNEFIQNGRLNMKLVLERFVETFDDLYGEENEQFLEEVGRKYFMLFYGSNSLTFFIMTIQ